LPPPDPRSRSSDRPLGGSSGDWRGRILRFHLPVAFVAAVALALFMTLPLFDPLAYSQMDMQTRGLLPQPMDMGPARMEPGGDVMAHDGVPAPSGGHSGTQTQAPSDHGPRQSPASDHGGAQPAGHSGERSASEEVGRERARERFDQRLTVATGYIATLLLALTLLVGPANLLLRRRNPVSSYLRRDAGMWTAAFSVVHVVVGLQVHSGGQLSGFLSYFFGRDGGVLLNSFGLANWIGVVATVVVIGLLTISSDLALRTLKAPRWKWLQRLNYALFGLVVAHAIFFGALLRLGSPFTLLLGISVIAVLSGQLLGIWLWRRRHRPTVAIAA
jgi:sulfoxide reductase heme-binding subunit YedZ